MPYQNLNDETLVMLTLAGEQDAYEVLVKRCQRAVIASAFSVTHTEFLAEDAAQDAFVSAWMKLDRLKDGTKFAPWVCRIAKNCAVNLVKRYRGFIALDAIEHYASDSADSPIVLYEIKEERLELHKSVERLPKKVQEIIRLHYFEGLSIVEIAEKLKISQGTVKSGLYDGRQKLRKELGAMDEKQTDTLVEKVMKKVAEMKLWQLKSNKDGFEAVYRDVLQDVESLPESIEKQHALADVLMHGWWWLPGEKNDALFARIKEAAEQGHNEEVMSFIITREDSRIPAGHDRERIEFIQKNRFPTLNQSDFPKRLAKNTIILRITLTVRNGMMKLTKPLKQPKLYSHPPIFTILLSKMQIGFSKKGTNTRMRTKKHISSTHVRKNCG